MSKSIRVKPTPVSKIRPSPSKTARIDPGVVAHALGAESQSEERRAGGFGPITLYGVREALMRRRQSSGGRPALEGTDFRAKIPLSDREWSHLEELASTLSSAGFSPSAGQVASVLLSMALESVTDEASQGSDAARARVAQQLAVKDRSQRS